jgi:short-subunit dehydrogenase
MRVNLMGVVHGIEAAYPIMIAQKSGHIVNTSSLAGLFPVPLSMAYVAAKHAVVGLSHSLRIDARNHNVRVSVVCPAAVDTAMFANAEYVNFDAAKMLDNVPGPTMSADGCARAVLKGVLANAETIVPGPARAMWLMNRFVPSLSRLLARSIGRKMSTMRTPPPPQALEPSSLR